MLERILEPEVMDTPEEAKDYNTMDHSTVNRRFVDDLLAAMGSGSDHSCRVLDAGTGTALIPIELASRDQRFQIVAIDMAAEMLKLAQSNIDAAGVSNQINLQLADGKQLPFPDGAFDVVMSNSIIHHIPDPFGCLSESWRVLRPGGLFFFRDLFRPADQETLNHLVDAYAGQENAHSRQMFRDSLHAALTVEEVQRLVRPLDIPSECVQQTTDRHWTLSAWKT